MFCGYVHHTYSICDKIVPLMSIHYGCHYIRKYHPGGVINVASANSHISHRVRHIFEQPAGFSDGSVENEKGAGPRSTG